MNDNMIFTLLKLETWLDSAIKNKQVDIINQVKKCASEFIETNKSLTHPSAMQAVARCNEMLIKIKG